MPVELTPEEQTKFDEVLKERGYDAHAADVIKKRGEEAKQHRERAEKAENELKTLRDADVARKAEEDKRKSEEDAKRIEAENKAKTLEQRLADFEKKYAEKLDAGNKEAEKRHAELLAQIEKRDGRLVSQAVRAAAKERGIIDVDLVELLDIKSVKVADGEVDQSAIDELIEGHVKAKPHLYKESSGGDDRARDPGGRFSRPDPAKKPGGGINWATLSDKEFAEKEALLRAGRL